MAASLKPIKPGTSGASAPGIRDLVKSKVVGPSNLNTKRVVFHDLTDAEGQWVKVLFYGESGTGKTRVLKDLVKLGFKVLVISTDFGGSGLSTVRNELTDEGLKHLGRNIIHADFPTYADIEDFLEHPEQYSLPGYDNVYSFDPDWIVWEGFSGYQLHQVDTKVSGMTAQRGDGGKAISEQRLEGLRLEQTDWDAVKRATLRPLNNFLNLHNFKTGKAWHKYVTAHETEPTDKNPRWRPLLQGAAGKLLENAFDIIIETEKYMMPGKAGEPQKVGFRYKTCGHDIMTKSRGYNLLENEEADFSKLWVKITKYLDGAPTVKKEEISAKEETVVVPETSEVMSDTEPANEEALA